MILPDVPLKQKLWMPQLEVLHHHGLLGHLLPWLSNCFSQQEKGVVGERRQSMLDNTIHTARKYTDKREQSARKESLCVLLYFCKIHVVRQKNIGVMNKCIYIYIRHKRGEVCMRSK